VDARPRQTRPLLLAGAALWLVHLVGASTTVPASATPPTPGLQAWYAVLGLVRDAGLLLLAGGLLLLVLAWYAAWRTGPAPRHEPGVDHYR
jgi:hypothetical protein